MQDLSSVKIIFSDIDGTLLPFTGKDLGPTAALIRALLEKGILFVPCTGRGTCNIPKAIMDIPGLPYAITANGAIITDLTSGEKIYNRRVARPLAVKLTHFLRRYPGNAYLYRDGQHHLDTGLEQQAISRFPRTSQSLNDWMDTVVKCDFLELLRKEESEWVDKFGFATPDQSVFPRIREDLKGADFYPELLVSSSGTWNVEINAAGASKGEAALWLAEALGLKAENLLCAGDNYNDLSMLTIPGCLAVAPEGAVDEVKAAAHIITPPCEEDGVESLLKKLLD